MRRDIDMNALWSAVRLAGHLADREYSRAVGPDAYREAKSSQLTAQRGMAAYDALAQEWPRMRDLRSAADREYDRYVTREPSIEDRGCSCHISAPCSYCTRDADAADEALTQPPPRPPLHHSLCNWPGRQATEGERAMTEDEAKAKWCPFVRVAVEFNQYVGSANRGLAKDEEPHSTCIAPACMAWRWVAEFASRAEAAYRRDGARLRPEQGFCGLAGRPE